MALGRGQGCFLDPNDKTGLSIKVANSDAFTELGNDEDLCDEISRYKNTKPNPFSEVSY